MKIKNIERAENMCVYTVTFEPNWFEKLLGKKEETKQYKTDGSSYTFGSGNVYYDKSGETLGNGNWIGEAIDKFRHSW